MSSQRGAPGDPRTARAEATADEVARALAESRNGSASGTTEAPVVLRWDGATPPPAAAADAEKPRCHACDAVLEGEPAGHGLLLFIRGDTIEREEPPLCEACGHAIGMTALWNFLDEEEG
jgi:hypothetical protein